MKGRKTAAILLSALLLAATGCTAPSYSLLEKPDRQASEQEQAAGEYLALLLEPALATMEQPEIAPVAVSRGSGEIAYKSGVKKLTKTQEKVLTSYMDAYFESLAGLKAQDISDLFAKDAQEQATKNKTVWEAIVSIRKMQQTDLSLTSYTYTLTCQSVTKDGEDIVIRAYESNTQKFKAYPSTTSKAFNISHSFTLTPVSGGWKLRNHRQYDSINNMLIGRGSSGEGPSESTTTKSKLVNQAKTATAGRKKQGVKPGKVTADNPYDREAAVTYARQWVAKRNPSWPTYDRMGGNCQNFVSQALYAGGIPMDHTSPGQWKWYGGTPNAAFQASGRAPAWSGVNDFLSYVKTNEGYGLVARANVPFYTGEVGDVIHLGTEGKLRHTVIISKVMTDEKGNVVDYLVCSNTADLRDFPVSAYHYTNQVLIKIYGWNNP